MSTHTKWVVDEPLPEVVCFVDSASDRIRGRYVNEVDIPSAEAELTARWEAAISDLGHRDTLLKAMWTRIKSEYPQGGFPDMGMFEDELTYMGII